jgi:hypothetical protein
MRAVCSREHDSRCCERRGRNQYDDDRRTGTDAWILACSPRRREWSMEARHGMNRLSVTDSDGLSALLRVTDEVQARYLR